MHTRDAAAFSLIEVVVAVGIFAIGVVTVIGLFGALAKSAGETTVSETAAHLGDVLRVELQARAQRVGFLETNNAFLKTPGQLSSDPRTDSQLLFASRDGIMVGQYNDPIWDDIDAGKFFEIALVRTDGLSPEPDTDANIFAYTATIRWPAFVPDSSPANPRHAGPADRNQQQSLFLPGAIMR
jgi:type II secretory pathway pseudopilin PulG